MMQTFNIPVGISDFSEIRQNGYYYVDKTGLIAELIKQLCCKSHPHYKAPPLWQNPWHEHAGCFLRYS